MSYGGNGKYTNWMSLTNETGGSISVTSENVPAIVDGATQFTFSVDIAMAGAFSAGVEIILSFFNGSNTQLASQVTSQTSMTAGTHYQLSTTPIVCPAGSSYVTATIATLGANAQGNPVNIYKAAVETVANGYVPDILNYNYAFANGTWPWTCTTNASIQANSSPLQGSDGNFDSLVIGGIIELMGGASPGVATNVAGLVDPVSGVGTYFRISTPGGQLTTLSQSGSGPYDLGTPQPTQDFVESLLLDGERPFGSRTSNRTMTIPIGIYAPTQQCLNNARDYLLSVIDQQDFEITWTPAATGLSMVYPCFRALPSTVMYGFNNLREGVVRNGQVLAPAIGLVTVNIQAEPFAKSGVDGRVQVDFGSNLVNGPPIASAVILDNFSGTIDTADGWLLNEQYPVLGSYAVFHRNPTPMHMPWPPTLYSATLPAPVNLAGLPLLAVWLGQSYDTQWPSDPKFISNVTVYGVLTDAYGNHIDLKTSVPHCPWSANPNKPAWKQVSLPIPQGRATFDYTQVASYSLRITNWTGGGQSGFVRMHAWLGLVSANPQSVQNLASPRGVLYNMFPPAGSARAPVAAQVQLPNASPVVQEFYRSGTWQVPVGVYSLKAEAWGAGGGGASVSSIMEGGGGGGGEYACETLLSVQPGQKIPLTVGQGGTGAQLSPTVLTYSTPGALTWTCPANVTQIMMEAWAGGAAGTAGGGGGGAGEYAAEPALSVTPGTTYAMWVGAGGKPNWGTTSQANASRNGQNSWFGNPGTKYAANALVAANGGTSPLVGSAEGGRGGIGSSNTTHFRGGDGGRSPGNAGGGGGQYGNSTGAGKTGGASPKAGSSGDYTVGGTGAGTAGAAGSGGNGSNAPGSAGKGIAPGGGGGGGYTRAVNNQGAPGGNGQLRITYYVNNSSPVNGGNTTFGSAGTTGIVVTAHGGTTAAANFASGGLEGSGSSNLIHYNGGRGGLAQRSANYLARPDTAWTSLANAAMSATLTATTSAAAASCNFGMLGVIVGASAALSNESVTDSAGNDYYLVDSVATTGGWLGFYASTVKNAIVSGTTTLTVATGTTVTAEIAWLANTLCIDLDDADCVSGAGSGTTVTFPGLSIPDTTTIDQELCVLFNASGQAPTGLTTAPAVSVLSGVANGSYRIDAASRQSPGSLTTYLWSATTYGSSANYAVLRIPFILMNRQAQEVPVVSGSVTGTTTTLTLGNNAPNIEVNSGTLFARVQVASSRGTPGITDSVGNTWTNQGSVSMGTTTFYLFTASVTHKLRFDSTITVTNTTSQLYTVAVRLAWGATGFHSLVSATGTGTSAQVTSASSAANPGMFDVFITGNGNSAQPSAVAFSNAAQDLAIGASANGVLVNNEYVVQRSGATNSQMTATYAASQSWGAAAISFTVTQQSGGGGSSAGVAAIGTDGVMGPSGGAPAFAGGGHGGNGLLVVKGPGLAGSIPGGAGGGALGTDSTALQGGAGANGLVRITHNPPLITFNDFLLHRPGDEAPADLVPIVPIPPSDPPDNREYAVPANASGRTAKFSGTYTVMLCNASWDTPSAARRISVTVNQYEYPGGPAISMQATSSLTPDYDVVNGYVSMGALTLPIKSVDMSNSDSYFTVSIHDTNQNDSFQDLIFLDTQGQTVLVNIATGSAGDGQYCNFYVDEPSYNADLGKVLGTSHERDRAISVTDMAMLFGGPLYVAPGDNLLLVYSTKGAPNLQVTYTPRWYTDRLV